MKNLPRTDEEYFKLLERLVKGAIYLENPLITEEDHSKGMKLYDAIEAEIEAYKQSRRDAGDYSHRPANDIGTGRNQACAS